MEIAQLVLEYLKALLTAQVMGAAVVVFFLLRFRPAINDVIGRILSAKGPGGFEATFDAQRKATEEGKKTLEEAKPEALAVRAHDTLEPADQARIEAAAETARQFGRWWLFEKIYRSIFRSQIMLLRYLDAAPGRRAQATELWQFYQLGILGQGVAPATYPWENYVRFLGNWHLITWAGPLGQEEVSLTDDGHEFLAYIAAQNYNINERPN